MIFSRPYENDFHFFVLQVFIVIKIQAPSHASASSLPNELKRKKRLHLDHRWVQVLEEIWETPLSEIKTQCVRSKEYSLAFGVVLDLFFKLEVFHTITRALNVTTILIPSVADSKCYKS